MLERTESARRRERQVEFPREQAHHPLLTPVLLGVAVVCTIIVIIVVSTDTNGPFLGPW